MTNPPKIPGLGAFIEKSAGASKPAAPHLVVTAARLLLAAAAVQIIASVMAVMYAASPERLVAIQAQIDAMSGAVPSLEATRNMGVITVVLAGIATVSAYVLFAFFLRKGRTWARVAAGVLAVLTLTQLVGFTMPQGLTTVAQIILGGLAVGLCYLPEANKYFAVAKAARS
ncbi:hypothetical protein AAFM46_13530 [Arthrobacter sp. TMP15]|uniref:hypothetical protein n=1 Tax=Arthrobacter sp. TMP15 TaxID=3140789 RepID=UPI0031BA89F5